MLIFVHILILFIADFVAFNSFCLSQVVSTPTHLCPNGSDSMIDLIAMSSPSLLQSCETLPPLENSDHLGLLLKSHWKHRHQPQNGKPRSVWRYNNADWEKANELL